MDGWMSRWSFGVGVWCLVCWWSVDIYIRDHGHAHGSRRSDFNNCLGANPGGILGAAGLLVDPSLPDGQAAKCPASLPWQ